MKILVQVTGDRVGDGLLKLPVLRGFRRQFPDARMTWVTSTNPSIFSGRLAPLASGLLDEIDEKSGLGKHWLGEIPTRLRHDYDVVMSTETSLRESFALRRLRAKRFISPALGFLLSSNKPTIPFRNASAFERFLILMNLAAEQELEPEFEHKLPRAMREEAELLLPQGSRYAGICPGAGGASKRWPLENFVGVAQSCKQLGLTPVFFLGPEEAGLISDLAQAVPDALFPESGSQASFRDSPLFTIALAERMQLSVCNDSGGGHLIAAGGNPVITLFGHTNAEKFRSPYCQQIALKASELGGGYLERIGVEVVVGEMQGLLGSMG